MKSYGSARSCISLSSSSFSETGGHGSATSFIFLIPGVAAAADLSPINRRLALILCVLGLYPVGSAVAGICQVLARTLAFPDDRRAMGVLPTRLLNGKMPAPLAHGYRAIILEIKVMRP